MQIKSMRRYIILVRNILIAVSLFGARQNLNEIYVNHKLKTEPLIAKN
jgi:hypothetical protein